MPSFIPSQSDKQTQNNIKNSSVPTTDNQVSLLDENSKEKNKGIIELRTILNNLNELKIKIENKNNQISSLKRELDQSKNSKRIQENEITLLKEKLVQIKKIEQARALEKIEESSFFEP